MRLLATNLADTGTLTASPACVATLPETNLQNSHREQVARWTAVDGQQFLLQWPSSHYVSCVCLYRNNFTSAATWRVRVWEDTTLTTALYDSGTVYCNPPVPLGSLEWGVDELGDSLYSDWDYAIAVAWFAPTLTPVITIDVADPAAPSGYLQASRLFVGQYFEPSIGPSDGLSLSWVENTQQARTEGGSLRVEAGASWRKLNVDLGDMTDADRMRLSNMARGRGMRDDVFVSVFPGQADEMERDYQMQARIVTPSAMQTTTPVRHATALSFEEI
jgi:hypothetical protein